MREEGGMAIASFHYPILIMSSIKIRSQNLEQRPKKKPLSYKQALLISSVPKPLTLKIKDR